VKEAYNVVRPANGPGIEAILLRLPWDSEHFGFAVAKIRDPDMDDASLEAALLVAKQSGIHLVYWATDPQRQVAAPLLRTYSGRMVDRKATFLADLAPTLPKSLETQAEGFRILEYPKAPASEQLVFLAIAAGTHSRFNVDPHIPKDKCESLYETWIRRSTLREIADVVLTATEVEGETVGMITVSKADAVASIGLVAVLQGFQGQGIGHSLVSAAHEWMIARGAKQARVVTQLDNTAACRLYERCGYRLQNLQRYYHFWIQGADGSRS
jgi:dTDP-4-amino-4,6-dideoxy-D-galactose acyltransferase